MLQLKSLPEKWNWSSLQPKQFFSFKFFLIKMNFFDSILNSEFIISFNSWSWLSSQQSLSRQATHTGTQIWFCRVCVQEFYSSFIGVGLDWLSVSLFCWVGVVWESASLLRLDYPSHRLLYNRWIGFWLRKRLKWDRIAVTLFSQCDKKVLNS